MHDNTSGNDLDSQTNKQKNLPENMWSVLKVVRDIAQEEMKITKRQFLVPPLGYMSDVAKILFYSISCFQKFLNSQHILIRVLMSTWGFYGPPWLLFYWKDTEANLHLHLLENPENRFSRNIAHVGVYHLSEAILRCTFNINFNEKKKKENSGKPITQNPSNNLSSNEIITLKHLTKKSQEVDLL